jgi:hypothetical protein
MSSACCGSNSSYSAGSGLNSVRSTDFFSWPVTLRSACCALPGVLMKVCVVAAMPYSASAVPLRLVKMRPSSPRMPSYPVPPEIQSLP